MLQSIELFSGSGRVSQVLRTFGFQTLTVDIDPGCAPDLCIDILNLDINSLPGSVQFFWASPDCRFFSRAAAQRHWKKTTTSYRIYDYQPLTFEASTALNLLSKTIYLINHFQPGVWFIENPVGRLHHTLAMRSLPHYRYFVNYSDWGFPYSKETYIFTNQLLALPISCPKSKLPGLRSVSDKSKRSLIPSTLIEFLISHSNFQTTIDEL